MKLECDMCKKPFGSFLRTEGDDFSYYYQCAHCLANLKQKQMLQLALEGELPDGDRECPECDGSFEPSAFIDQVCLYCHSGVVKEQ